MLVHYSSMKLLLLIGVVLSSLFVTGCGKSDDTAANTSTDTSASSANVAKPNRASKPGMAAPGIKEDSN